MKDELNEDEEFEAFQELSSLCTQKRTNKIRWTRIEPGLWFEDRSFTIAFMISGDDLPEAMIILNVFSNCIEYNNFLVEC